MEPTDLLPPSFSVAVVDDAATRTLVPRGDLDVATADRLVAHLGSLDGVADLVVDLREVGFVDSSGVRALMVVRRATDRAGVALTLLDDDGPASEVLRLTGLQAELPVTRRPAG